MPAQDTAETILGATSATIADAAPEPQVDRRLLIEEFLERKTFAVPVLGAPA